MADISQLEQLMELVLEFSMLSFRCGRQKQVCALPTDGDEGDPLI